jgi:predicted RNA-binding protein associated with RNAse of E/G family
MIRPERVKGQLTFSFIRPPDRRVSLKSRLLDARDETIVLATELSPSKPVDYFGEIVMGVGYWAVWFLFKGRPFDVGRVYRPDGTWTGYYVDILEPVQWKGSDPNTLEPIIDLFLDLWVAPDGKYMILDEDEFEEAISLGHLTSEQIDHARSVLRELIEATERKEFPPAVVREFWL